MLAGPWKEGTKTSDGCFHVTAEDWDPTAFLHIMHILHSRSDLVPQNPRSVNELVNLAVIVDYYKLHNAVAHSAALWLYRFKTYSPVPTSLPTSVPTSYDKETVFQWLFVAWTFKQHLIFQQMSQLAIMHHIPEHLRFVGAGLPIPSSIIGQFQHSLLHLSITGETYPSERVFAIRIMLLLTPKGAYLLEHQIVSNPPE